MSPINLKLSALLMGSGLMLMAPDATAKEENPERDDQTHNYSHQSPTPLQTMEDIEEFEEGGDNCNAGCGNSCCGNSGCTCK